MWEKSVIFFENPNFNFPANFQDSGDFYFVRLYLMIIFAALFQYTNREISYSFLTQTTFTSILFTTRLYLAVWRQILFCYFIQLYEHIYAIVSSLTPPINRKHRESFLWFISTTKVISAESHSQICHSAGNLAGKVYCIQMP